MTNKFFTNGKRFPSGRLKKIIVLGPLKNKQYSKIKLATTESEKKKEILTEMLVRKTV